MIQVQNAVASGPRFGQPAAKSVQDLTAEIWEAITASDWQKAVDAWSGIAPDSSDASGCIGAAWALRRLRRFDEGDALLEHALGRFPDYQQIWIDRGWLEIERENWDAAVRRWREARAAGFDHESLALGEALALRKLRRYAEAEAILIEAAQRRPSHVGIARDLASVAGERGNWSLAVQRYEWLLTVHPDNEQIQNGLISALLELRNYQRADEIVSGRLSRTAVPEPQLLIQHAEIARHKQDWVAAEKRWRSALDVAPDDDRIVVGLADSLIYQRRYEEADQVLANARTRFPDNIDLARRWADCVGKGGSKAEALSRWQQIHQQWPDDGWIRSNMAGTLLDIGRFEDARQLLERSMPLHPRHRGLLYAQATLATRTGSWDLAQKLWQDLVATYPDEDGLREKLTGVRLAARLSLLGETDPQKPETDVPPANRESSYQSRMHDVVCEFESIGCDCEFGLVQRYFEAEPLGLLRWAGTLPDDMVAAARAKFDGVGEPENLSIDVWPSGEYCIVDKRFKMLTHSFTYQAAVAKDVFYKQQVRRGRYLKQKLIGDLQSAEKIFVYKSNLVTEAHANDLFAALRGIGPICLLVVFQADEANPPSSVKWSKEGLLYGYVAGFHNLQTALPAQNAKAWALLCERALALYRERNR